MLDGGIEQRQQLVTIREIAPQCIGYDLGLGSIAPCGDLLAGKGFELGGIEIAVIRNLFRRLRRHRRPLDPRGAELVLRDLADRVELRVGQDVGRRLDVGERDEHHALGHRAVDARLELDRAAPGRDPDRLARRHAEPAQLARMQARHRLRLERVEMLARRVIAPVCQCSSWRPVVSTIG